MLKIVYSCLLIFISSLMPANAMEKAKVGALTIYNSSEIDCDEGVCTDHDGTKITGILRSYHPSGTIAADERFENGMLNGESRSYHVTSGKLKNKSQYRNGIKEGKAFTYYENGSVFIEENLLNGVLDGEFTLYDSLGEIKLRGHYKNGDAVGEGMIYNP